MRFMRLATQTPPQAPVVTPVPAVGAQTPSFEALQALTTDLTVQLAGLRAERSVLQQQLRGKTWDPATRPEQIARYADVSAKIARAEADLDRVALQIAQRQGVDRVQIGPTGRIMQPPPFMNRRSGADPDMVVG